MLRQGLRRCARQATSCASSSALLQSRSALRVVRQISTPEKSAILSIRSAALGHGFRFYSSVADAEIETPDPEERHSRFEDLESLNVHPNLLSSIRDGMGFDKMTPVQKKTIIPALKGSDIVAQAKTGTGKTIAFLLPMLQRMINDDANLATRRALGTARSNDIRGIVISPTRELAEQIAVEAERLVKNTGLVVQRAVGGTRKAEMLRKTQREGCHLLVATPGRLNDLLSDPSSGVDAPNLSALVLDEADRMLDVGFERELAEITDSLPKDKIRQTMLVSATIPDNVIRLARNMVRPQDFEFVQTIPEHESLTHAHVPQYLIPVRSWSEVIPAMWGLIDREAAKRNADRSLPPFKAIVYFNTTALVELAGSMAYERRGQGISRFPCWSIHSRSSQLNRQRAADLFRSSRSAVLFSSDVTARGMDFPDVTHVIQVDCPQTRETYIHRLGRTGRQEKEGQGWLIMPSISMGLAKSKLTKLPLQQDETWQDDDMARYKDQTKQLGRNVSDSMKSASYLSILGPAQAGGLDRYSVVEEMNAFATECLGMESPPPVSAEFASKLYLQGTALNIQERPERRGSTRSFGGDAGYGSRRDRDSRGRGRGNQREDPFGSFRDRIRRN